MNESTHHKTCQACLSDAAHASTITCTANGADFGKALLFWICPSCGFAEAPGNIQDFQSKSDFQGSNMPDSSLGRTGAEDHPGREYLMASMAAEILDNAKIEFDSILLYGAGMSLDHRWLSRKFPQKKVAVCDIDNFQEIENFVRLDSNEKFDIVVACEVVEHFIEIRENFSRLLSKVSESGICVLSTNISDGGPLEKLTYPFIGGHTAYYSGRSLACIAKSFDSNFRLDFRPPMASLAQLGPRKRYTLLYRSEKIQAEIALYFSRNFMAPSEPCIKKSLTTKVRRLATRMIRRTPITPEP